MASAFTHAFVAVAAGKVYAREPMGWRFWVASIALSILPDLDVIGFAFGIRYEDFLGHRGFSHSIVFAGLAGAAVLVFQWRALRRPLAIAWLFVIVQATAIIGWIDGTR